MPHLQLQYNMELGLSKNARQGRSLLGGPLLGAGLRTRLCMFFLIIKYMNITACFLSLWILLEILYFMPFIWFMYEKHVRVVVMLSLCKKGFQHVCNNDLYLFMPNISAFLVGNI